MTASSADSTTRNTLIHGNVQSGKTASIMKILTNPKYRDVPKVLIVQNSLLVAQQYTSRFTAAKISHQVINKKSEHITSDTIIVMNNVYRYKAFLKIVPKEYVLILDEADLTIKNCPLVGLETYHVTATSFSCKDSFDHVASVPIHNNYHGIEDLTVSEQDDETEVVKTFLKEKTGMMLINKYSTVEAMTECAHSIATKHPQVPVILLTSHKILFINNTKRVIKLKTITSIIDLFTNFSHLIFVAHRLSSRGLSYTSSDYQRHLTYQVTKVRATVTNFVQSLRILGIYSDQPSLKLFVDDITKFEKMKRVVLNYDPKTV